MTRLNLMLVLAILVSALYLVHVQYESRTLVTALDLANAQARKIDTEHQRLLVERRSAATTLRIEKVAREQLQMRDASPSVTQYVTFDASRVEAAR